MALFEIPGLVLCRFGFHRWYVQMLMNLGLATCERCGASGVYFPTGRIAYTLHEISTRGDGTSGTV